MSWFATWFDSPFYHILYKNRNDDEARFFIDNLTTYLQPKSEDTFLDLACGKGRHSIYLHSKGLKTYGCDLSPQSIAYAKKYETKNLHFFEHDMRQNITFPTFQFVLNLFTSFGYFEDKNDNLKTLLAIANALVKDGILVIDFFNSNYILSNLVPSETKNIDNISFNITKIVENGYIKKNIDFNFDNQEYHFTEKVQALTLQDFEWLLEKANFKIKDIFGGYGLEKFDLQNSKRLILVAQKNE